MDITPGSRWLDTGETRLNTIDWRRVFEVEAVEGDTVRGKAFWEVRDRADGDERVDVEAPWGTIDGGVVTQDQFFASEFGDRLKPFGT